MNTAILPDESSVYFDERGILQVHDLGAGVSLHVRRGVMTAAFARYVVEDGERQLDRSGRYFLLVDGLQVKMHTTEFRDVTTEFFKRHASTEVHVLIQSRMLEMAINVANLVMGVQRARAYFNKDIWESVGRQEVKDFATRPLFVPESWPGKPVSRAGPPAG